MTEKPTHQDTELWADKARPRKKNELLTAEYKKGEKILSFNLLI
jgi:hypothetical protein